MNPKKLLLSAAIALVFFAGSAPAFAGTCDGQGRRVQVGGVWKKIVRHKSGRLVMCPAW